MYVSEKVPIFRDTRVGTDCRTAVRPRHAAHGAIPRHHSGRGIALGATQKAANHKPGGVPKHQHSGIRRASARRAEREWSDSSLQVEDPKASGTPTSLANIYATFLSSATTTAAHSIMVCALCQRRSLASAQACSSDLPSSCAYLERYRNDCRPLWMVFPALNRSKYVSAASVRAASCSYRVRP